MNNVVFLEWYATLRRVTCIGKGHLQAYDNLHGNVHLNSESEPIKSQPNHQAFLLCRSCLTKVNPQYLTQLSCEAL